MKHYLFLDTETTGTDPSSDALLEVAWFITDENFTPVSGSSAYAVQIDEGTTIASLSAMNDYVRDMHTTSGLLADLDEGATLDYIFAALAEDIDSNVGPDDTLHMAGFSIHFDVDFLKANDFGSLWNEYGGRKPKIHHRHLDLSSVKMMLDAAGLTKLVGYDENLTPHRALYDCMEALMYAKRVRGFLGRVFPFPPVPAEEAVDTGPTITIVEGSDIL